MNMGSNQFRANFLVKTEHFQIHHHPRRSGGGTHWEPPNDPTQYTQKGETKILKYHEGKFTNITDKYPGKPSKHLGISQPSQTIFYQSTSNRLLAVPYHIKDPDAKKDFRPMLIGFNDVLRKGNSSKYYLSFNCYDSKDDYWLYDESTAAAWAGQIIVPHKTRPKPEYIEFEGLVSHPAFLLGAFMFSCEPEHHIDVLEANVRLPHYTRHDFDWDLRDKQYHCFTIEIFPDPDSTNGPDNDAKFLEDMMNGKAGPLLGPK